MKKLFTLLLFAIGLPFLATAQFVHPGITHKKSDLDRMKYMVEAQIDPWYSSYQEMVADSKSSYNYNVRGNPSFTLLARDAPRTNYNAWNSDIRAAYYNAIQWYITEDSRHADKAIEIFNSWKNLTSVTSNGTDALSAGIGYIMIEAAEIIKGTYDGWSNSDINDFKDMLVYPGYSTTTVPSGNTTFYWKGYQGDPIRHGNQGLSGLRTVMAIGIFLDNEIIYDRVLRYVKGESHRSDDFPYPSGPNTSTSISSVGTFADTYNVNRGFSTEDYGYDEVMTNYIYDNGQCQESARDHQHTAYGIGNLNSIAEMSWNQGDDLYSHANDRLLLGLEYNMRYNVSAVESYPDQTSPWEPTVASGEFLEGFDRTGRFYSKAMSTTGRAEIFNGVRPVFEMPIAHYVGRGFKTEDQAKWIIRARDRAIVESGFEDAGFSNDAIGWGALVSRRVDGCYGDPISGFDGNGLPIYAMNVLPMTIEAENYDYSPVNGEGRTYHDTNNGNRGGQYRTDDDVDIQASSEGGYNVGWIATGEYLTYTVNVPSTGPYKIEARVASPNGNGQFRIEFDDVDKTGNVTVPNTGNYQSWQTMTVSDEVTLTKGVKQMKVYFSNSGMNLNNISFTRDNIALGQSTNQSSDRPSDGFAENAVDGNTDGTYSSGSVTHTLTDTNPWWEVDLGSDQSIGDIVIYGRTDSCCSGRLSDYTVTVTDSSNNTVFTENITNIPDPSESIDAGGVIGRIVRVQLNGTNALSLAEVEVYSAESTNISNAPTTPEAGKTYYIDNPHWDLRLGADGAQDAYTTSTSTTGSNVEWTVTASPTAGFFYVDCNGGGSAPRIRTDRTANADMQATSSSGSWTRWEFTDAGNSSFHMTVLDNTSFERLQINNSGEVKMVNETLDGAWETFTFTEVVNSNAKKSLDDVNIERFNDSNSPIRIYPNPVQNEFKVMNLNSEYSQFNIYNIYGALVRNGTITSETKELSVNMNGLSKGTYILNLIGSQTIKSFKIIKQ